MKECLFLGDEKVVNDEFLSLLNKANPQFERFERYGYDCLAEKNADGSGFIY